MKIFRGIFNGFSCVWLETPSIRMSLALDGGLRVLSFSSHGGANLFAELGDLEVGDPRNPYRLIGGHRLWHAPEWAPRTYLPEVGPFRLESGNDWVSVFTQPDASGIAKSIRVELPPDRSVALVTHHLTNTSLWPVTLAGWAITQFPPGGVVLCPQNTELVNGNIATPNRFWVLWPFTDIRDGRFQFGNRVTLLNARFGKPTKIGDQNNTGSLAYWKPGWIFIKMFDPSPFQPHTDLNANSEIYLCDDFVEIETLSPLRCLQPGESLQYVETWIVKQSPDELLGEEDALMLLEGSFSSNNHTTVP